MPMPSTITSLTLLNGGSGILSSKLKLIHSHGGFELAVDRLVSCYGFSLTCGVNSLLIVPLDVDYCTLHSIYLSLSDYISLIR